ncbi:MAG: general secretion pathway protein GspB [Pseudomonadales bacterium]
MSFVLEALKKQEAQGDPDAAVSLARQTAYRQRYRLWMGLFGVAMALNAVVLFWVFGLPLLRSADAPAGPAPAAAALDGPPPAGADAAPRPSAPAGADPAVPGTGEPAAAAEPAVAPRPEPRPAPRPIPVTLDRLPDDARTRFPGIAFSTHIYAEDADLRAIVANGQRLQEGDRIRGLEILAITETGVVLRFERYDVTVPIVGEW